MNKKLESILIKIAYIGIVILLIILSVPVIVCGLIFVIILSIIYLFLQLGKKEDNETQRIIRRFEE